MPILTLKFIVYYIFTHSIFRQQIRSQLKRKAYEEAGMSPPAEPEKPSPKKVAVAVQPAQIKQVIQVAQAVSAGQPQAKKQKASGW